MRGMASCVATSVTAGEVSGLDDFFSVYRWPLPRTVRQAEICLGTHLDQTRGRALEFISLISIVGEIKLAGLGLRRREQLHCIFIQCVDENDEPLGFVAARIIHHRNVVHNDGMEFMRNLEIVGGCEWLRAKFLERKTR